jgi:hypothetical protein
MLKKRIVARVLILAATITIFTISPAYAAEHPTVTIINELRGTQLGLEKANLIESLKGQWVPTSESSASATWLWQYSALENQEMTTFAKTQMQKNQEHGIFLEIDKNTAEKSGVDYKAHHQWYHSDGLLLISYDEFERHKLIDNIFEKFKQTFGTYPKSVGAWWVGAEPIQYMHQKYGITAVLQCADQFNTDAYSIWGTPWSIPYIPQRDNAAIPTKDTKNTSPVTVMQWAPRDPLRGYGPTIEESTYSIQDYERKGYKIGYFEYLKDIYAKKTGDQLVLGLEGGFPPEVYQNQYKEQVKTAINLQKDNKAKVQTMQDYAKDFLKRGQALPPTNYMLSKDYESNNQSFIYHSPYYRLMLAQTEGKITVVDLRDYKNTTAEDFYILPNTQPLLRIYTAAIIDSVVFPESKLNLTTSKDPLIVEKNANNSLTLKSGSKRIADITTTTLSLYDNKNKSYTYDFTPHWYDWIFNFLKNNQGTTKNRVITTPFEDEAVNFIKSQNQKEVIFLLPPTEPTYRAVRPILLADETYGKNKTGKPWKYQKSDEKITSDTTKDKLIVVPLYLGSNINSLGVQSANTKKIFDNAQIQIYKINTN